MNHTMQLAVQFSGFAVGSGLLVTVAIGMGLVMRWHDTGSVRTGQILESTPGAQAPEQGAEIELESLLRRPTTVASQPANGGDQSDRSD